MRPRHSYSSNGHRRKRQRDLDSDPEDVVAQEEEGDLEIDDEEFIRPVSASAKRARRSARAVKEDVDQEVNGVASEDDTDEEFEAQEDQVTPVHNGKRRNVSDANGAAAVTDVEDEDDEDEEEVQRQLRLSIENGFAHSGILHSVRLDRFMSHECFVYEFGQNVNIVQGPNGSGKSAIVAALQIGLLGKVGATERGRKLDDVIKHDRNDCVITVKILNRKPPKLDDGYMEPDLTYRHDVYGDIITLERRLVRGSAGGYSVKGRSGNKPVKLPQGVTPRQEILNIIDHFGFMVDNPVTILTQTKSKEFLAKGKPTDHFRLFRQATLLGPLQLELKRTREITTHTSGIYAQVQLNVPEAEEKLRKKESDHREAQEMKHIDARILAAEIACAWTTVQEEEMKLTRYETKTVEDFEPAAEKARVAYEKSQAEIETQKAEMVKHQEAVAEAAERSKSIGLAFREAQKAASKVDFELERQARKLREFDAEAEETREKIDDVKGRMQRAREEHFAGQEQKTRLIQEIHQMDREVKDLKERMKSSRDVEADLLEKKLQIEDDRTKAHRDLSTLERDFEAKRRQQLQVENAAKSKDNLARFGPGFSELCQRIHQNSRRFSRIPIGPVAQFISLGDESWAAAIESALGRNTLRAFIVHNSQDSSFLQSLIPHGSVRPIILIANMDRRRYIIQHGDIPELPVGDYCTILDTVSISNDAVFNYLVDQSQIERNVLDGTGGDVTQLGWSRIPNLHTVWNKYCDRAYSRNGSNTFRKGPPQPSAQMLTKDMRPYLESIREEIKSISDNLNDARRRAQETEGALRRIHKDVQDVNRDINQWQSKVTELETRKSRLEGKLNQAENAFDPAPFEQEIVALEENTAENYQQRTVTAEKETELKLEKEQAMIQVEEIKSSMREANTRTKTASNSLAAVQTTIAQLKSNDRHLKREYDTAAQRVADAHSELDVQRSVVTAAMESAMKLGSCPSEIDPRQKSSSEWKRDLITLKHRLETEQERRGGRSAAEIEMDYIRAKKKHEENKQALRRVKFYVNALNRGVRNREILLRDLDKSLRKLVRANFRKFLATRGHNGTIKFKSEQGQPELHIVTQMATHRKADGQLYTTKDNRALSGGEKSYTTLCFILALAEICQNPVRVMDEIDVFQDEGTRHASFRTIVTFCTQYLSNRQIIIITPHPLPNFDSNPSVRIQKLAAPRRESGRGRQTQIDQYLG